MNPFSGITINIGMPPNPKPRPKATPEQKDAAREKIRDKMNKRVREQYRKEGEITGNTQKPEHGWYYKGFRHRPIPGTRERGT